jgi:hypothetical protein
MTKNTASGGTNWQLIYPNLSPYSLKDNDVIIDLLPVTSLVPFLNIVNPLNIIEIILSSATNYIFNPYFNKFNSFADSDVILFATYDVTTSLHSCLVSVT